MPQSDINGPKNKRISSLKVKKIKSNDKQETDGVVDDPTNVEDSNSQKDQSPV